ncbi:hypothetical protein KDW_16110 [Dictyobacter vulcani]|uniref:Uncharacterized protein n=1 Tax=Dictyobacter vulcani TaxID=2607529 RepID=A0A5J4KMV3_9CHLR|nr:hypothetical protein [Dictyobacter vulcani]GER87449.1 hypothetical protein KDW_16110 [Dictyobacter vulcani]
MKRRSLFIIMYLIAPLAWGGLLLFTYQVSPSAPLPIVAFFLLLTIALLSLFFPLTYWLGQRLLFSRRYRATARQAFRQAVLLSFIVLANLILLSLHSWNLLTALIIVFAMVLVEVLSLARKM